MKKPNQPKKIEDLKRAVEKLHDCHASYIEDVIVIEKFGADTVWEGIVSVFSVKGHDKADKCYAWSSPIEGSTKRLFYVILHIPPVDSPEKAVRAAIVRDLKKDL
ncbi:MAG: hypothetical protein ACYC7J_16660 [Syntrophales bacterium]